METVGDFLPPINHDTGIIKALELKSQIKNPNDQENDQQSYPKYLEICQQLIQNPNSSHLFERYQVSFNEKNKLASFYDLKKAMINKYPPTSKPLEWEYSQDYEEYTGLSSQTVLNPQVLSDYISIEQAIIVTENNLPEPFTQKPTAEALKQFITKKHFAQKSGTFIETQEEIDKLIAQKPTDIEIIQVAKRINKIGGITLPKSKRVILSPQLDPETYLFSLAHETYHFSQINKTSQEKLKLFKDFDFVDEEEFEANLYALLYDPNPMEIDSPKLSNQEKLFYTTNRLMQTTMSSVISHASQLTSLEEDLEKLTKNIPT